MNPLGNGWWKITLARWFLKFFYPMNAEALHHFSYKTKSRNCDFVCVCVCVCAAGKGREMITFMRIQGTLNKCCWKRNTRQRQTTKKLQEDWFLRIWQAGGSIVSKSLFIDVLFWARDSRSEIQYLSHLPQGTSVTHVKIHSELRISKLNGVKNCF